MMDLVQAENYFRDMQQPFESQRDDEILAPLISVVAGSGGVGRSLFALLCTQLAAASGIATALIEGDLQFGDIGFWLGLDDELPDLGSPERCTPIELWDDAVLYKAPCFPEVAERVSDDLARSLPSIRAKRELVIADTGAFWSGFTADLLLQSDVFLLVMDHRPSSIVAAVKAQELCSRIGIPLARMVAVYNRWSPKVRISAEEARRALGVEEIFCIPDGHRTVEELLSTGDFMELAHVGDSVVMGVRELLTAVLPRVGRLYADAPIKHRRGLFG